MSQPQKITVEVWWNTATASGKSKYRTVDNLASQLHLSRDEKVTPFFAQEMGTLGDWWRILGARLYREGRGAGTGKEAMARELTTLLPKGMGSFPRTSLGEYIRGKSSPKYREYFAVLYAVTALPCFKLEGTTSPIKGAPPATTVPTISADDLQREIRFAEVLAEHLLEQLKRIASLHPKEGKTKLVSLLRDAAIFGVDLAEDEENQGMLGRLSRALGETRPTKKQR